MAPLPVATLLLAPPARLLRANTGGARLLRRGDGPFELRGQSLHPVWSCTTRFQAAIRAVATAADAWRALELRRGNDRCWASLQRSHEDEGVWMFVQTSDELGPPPEALRQLWSLTPTEARVAVALARGSSVRRIAEVWGLAPATVRTHLKRILSKTGFCRQSELVRACCCLPLAMLPGMPPFPASRFECDGRVVPVKVVDDATASS